MTKQSMGRIGLAALAVIAIVTVILAVQREPSESGTDLSVATPAIITESTAGDSALFVGDSFTAGVGVTGADAYAALVSRRLGWQFNVDAQGATGFLADGRGTGNGDTDRLIDRLPSDDQYQPLDILVVDAGRNDLGEQPEAIADAANTYLTAAHAQWPSARIVVVLPSFVSSDRYKIYSALSESFGESVRAVDGLLLDPIAEGWYSGVDAESLVVADGVHPNVTGNKFIADRIVESLREHGIA